MLEDKNWNTGSNIKITFNEIQKIIKQYIKDGAKIYIGSDSFNSRDKVCFASAICLYGKGLKGRYFFCRENVPDNNFIQLVTRITEETRRSVEIAEILMDSYCISPANIELHLDVSPFNANNGTSKFSEMLKGYVKGYGLDCKLKPDAWAGQTIADKHSK
jgi:predicted RNase H-related nuclease YkuK (DUF458 family)